MGIQDRCTKCNRPHDPDQALVEDFLVNGPPLPPESRATKDDLIKEIVKRDRLLHQLRNLFMRQFATQMVRELEPQSTPVIPQTLKQEWNITEPYKSTWTPEEGPIS